MYLPSKPKAAVASDNAREQSPSKQAELRHTERVAIGHDVEVTPSGASERIPQRIPSLDDVLRAVRGEGGGVGGRVRWEERGEEGGDGKQREEGEMR